MSEQEPNVDWRTALGEHAGNPALERRAGVYTVCVFWPCAACGGKGGDRDEATGEATLCDACKGTGKGTEPRGEFPVAPVENRIKAQFEDWLHRRAVGLIQQAESRFGPEEANRMRAAYVADGAAGLYNWEGRHSRHARGDLPGLKYLLYLLLRRCDGSVTESGANALWKADPGECSKALAWSLGNAEAPAGEEPLPGETRKNGTRNFPPQTFEVPPIVLGQGPKKTLKTAPPTTDG
jgi:hypothetical protein